MSVMQVEETLYICKKPKRGHKSGGKSDVRGGEL